MSVFEPEWLRSIPARPEGEHRFRLLATIAAALFVAYLAATAAGAPHETLSLVFSIAVLPVPFIAWWAYVRGNTRIRATLRCCAWAATLWLAGSLVWYGFFLTDGSTVPPSPGWWDILFAAAQLLLIAALIVAMRSFALVRIAALDACVVCSAGVALGAAFIGRGLESDVSPSTLTTLNRPLLGIVTLMLIAAAALGSWEGIPRSIVLLGLGEGGLTIGSLVYSYAAVQGDFVNDRWANLGWAAGAELSVLAATTIILGIDRPLRLPARRRMPAHPPGSRAVLLVSLAAISITLGVATHGLISDRRNVALIGILASITIAVAMVIRARDSLRTVERSSELLDSVLTEAERERARLDLANARLQQTNVSLRMIQLAVRQGFNLIDEQTQGRLREVVEQSGGDLAALVDETLEE